MKKFYLSFLLLAVCLGLYSCSKVESAIVSAESLSWDGVDVTITVPPVSDTSADTSIGAGAFSYNLDSFIKSQTANKLGLANLDTFQFLSCQLHIQNSSTNDNFANFETGEVSLVTNVNTTPSTVEIDNNPDTPASDLTIPINNTTNMKTYLSPTGTTTFSYTLMGKLRRPTDSTLTITVHLGYHIHVKP